MSVKRVGVAIVGCGAMGRVHAAIASGIQSIDVVAIVDAALPAAQRLADDFERAGLPRPADCQSLDAALSLPSVDLVVITTPSGLHVSQASDALDAGRHVLIEKPLDVELPRARVFAERARIAADAGLVASVVSQHRFDGASLVVAHALASGSLGQITTAIASTAWWRPQSYYDLAAWRGTWEMDGGGALMNQGVHNVDLLLSFLGRPIEVFGQTALLSHSRIEVEDAACAVVTFASGALATVHGTTAAYPGLATRLHLMGSKGSAVIEDDNLTYFHEADDSDVGPMGLLVAEGNKASEALAGVAHPTIRLGLELPPTPAGRYSLDPASHHLQYLDVLDAITNGSAPRVTVADSLAAMALIRAVYVSSTLGKPVLFDDVMSGAFDDLKVITGPHSQTLHRVTV
jgi:UDP-N-acetyl-2-amino-2-deoxyglucuronate dehydrogenase